MTKITATNPEAEHLAAKLREFASIAPPPGDVEVTVDHLGNRARPGHVFIDAGTVGKPWETGALAHEYAHVLQPDLGHALRMIRWWYIGAPFLAVFAIFLPAAAFLGQRTGWVVVPFFLVVFAAWSRGARASQPGELDADAKAVELLGPDEVRSLLTLLRRSTKRTKPTSADWFMPHPNPHRRIAAVQAIIAAS